MMKPVVAALVGLFTAGFAVGQDSEPATLTTVPVPGEAGAFFFYPESGQLRQFMPWPLGTTGHGNTSHTTQSTGSRDRLIVLHAPGSGEEGLEQMLSAITVERYEIFRLEAPQQIHAGDQTFTVNHWTDHEPSDLRPYLVPDLGPGEDSWVFDLRGAEEDLKFTTEWWGEDGSRIREIHILQSRTPLFEARVRPQPVSAEKP